MIQKVEKNEMIDMNCIKENSVLRHKSCPDTITRREHCTMIECNCMEMAWKLHSSYS